jgi:hypothetical protein
MRLAVLTCILTAAAFGATVDGRVVNSATGAGITGVTVTLMQDEHIAYTATTDTQGRFQIEDVKEGVYAPRYRQPGGFLVPSELLPGSPTLQVSADSGPVHLEVKLPPMGKLFGRVLDPAGAPVPDAMVVLDVQSGGYRFRLPRTSDAKGEYQFEGLPFAGDFVIAAMPPLNMKPPDPDDQQLAWAQTFYPGVTDREAAARLVLPPGGELWDLDIKLAAAPLHRIRGVVLDPRGVPVAGAALIVSGGIALPREPTMKSDGTFEFASATDGAWRISATLARDGLMLRAFEAVQVNGHDLDVKLGLVPPFSIQGKVVIEVPDGLPAPELPKVRAGAQTGAPDRFGNFTITNLYPGPSLIRPDPPPASYYLDSIRLGSGNAPGPQVQLPSGNQPLTLTYKHGGGTVLGTIESCGDGQVALLPVDSASRHLTIIRNTRCDPSGKFEILSVRPGQYYAFALPFDAAFSPFADLDSPLIQQSTVVTVVDNDIVTPEIHLIKR